MLPQKPLFICMLLLLSVQYLVMGQSKQLTETTKWVISQNSNLCVNGSTNINKFACEIPGYDKTDTLVFTKVKGNNEINLSGNIYLNVQSFDCHNIIMTNDLRKTLNAKQYPKLHIRFLSLNSFPALTEKPQMITGVVDIELAGVTKRFEVNYQVSQDAQKQIHLLGYRDVNFTDFNLVPPRKFGGMIRTDDKLSVAFHLRMKAMD